MNIIANNIANAQNTRSAKDGKAFRRQLVILRGESLKPRADPTQFGVRVKRIAPDMSPMRMVYDPGHPDANADGYVTYPNVDVSMEMVDLVAAQRAYEANIAVIVSDKRMAQRALDILQV